MNSVRIQKSGRRNQDNSEDIVEKIARRLLGRYLGVSAMYFSRPVPSVDAARSSEAEEADKASREGGEENKVDAAAHLKINETKWKAIQSLLLSYVLNSGEKARKIFSAGVF